MTWIRTYPDELFNLDYISSIPITQGSMGFYVQGFKASSEEQIILSPYFYHEKDCMDAFHEIWLKVR